MNPPKVEAKLSLRSWFQDFIWHSKPKVAGLESGDWVVLLVGCRYGYIWIDDIGKLLVACLHELQVAEIWFSFVSQDSRQESSKAK